MTTAHDKHLLKRILGKIDILPTLKALTLHLAIQKQKSPIIPEFCVELDT